MIVRETDIPGTKPRLRGVAKVSIFYHSTRSNEQLVTSKQAILRGIAPDGGLYVRDGLSDLGIDLDLSLIHI